MTEIPEDPLAQARRTGRLEGEGFDAELGARERREREDAFTRRIWGGGEEEESLPRLAGSSPGEVWRLQQRVEELAAFHEAVVGSRAWRLVQACRRPFGRAW